jgi:hypothetical protein
MTDIETIGLILSIVTKSGLLIFGVTYAIYEAVMRWVIRKIVHRLLTTKQLSTWQYWHLPAPESYILLRGFKIAKKDAFKLGIMHLMAAKVFSPEYVKAAKPGHGWETMLLRGPAPMSVVVGSLVAIYDLWRNTPEPRTVVRLTSQAKQKYGCIEGFAEKEVVPRLVNAGIYIDRGHQNQYPQATTSCTQLSQSQKVLDELGSRMSTVLHQMKKERPYWISKKPQQALFAAVVTVAAGQPAPMEEDELKLVTQGIEQEADPAVTVQEDANPDGSFPIWLDWLIFDNFEKTFVTVCVGGGSDGGDGGNSADTGDGDYGDFGGWD